MAKRIVTKIGDVFCVNLKDETKGYFQYVANDQTMLNSSVIRAFKKRYNHDESPKIEEIINDEVQFYAHTVLRWGIEYNAWHKIGKSNETGAIEVEKVLFGYTDKYGEDWFGLPIDVNPRKNWSIWHINKEEKKIGKLPRRYRDIVEFGAVVPYTQIVARMEMGCYTEFFWIYDEVKRMPFPHVHSYMKLCDGNTETSYHYIGDSPVQQLILSDGKLSRLIAGENLDLPKFYEINWRTYDFISEEEFMMEWNKYCGEKDLN